MSVANSDTDSEGVYCMSREAFEARTAAAPEPKPARAEPAKGERDVFEGGCQCGHLRYRIEGRARSLAVCHCRDCQRQSGSAFGMSLNVPLDAFRLVSGETRSFEVVCDSGRSKQCVFCAGCGTRIYHRDEGGISVKAGTLDDTRDLEPTAHYWTKRKQRWVVIPEDVRSFPDDGPEPDTQPESAN